MRRLGYSRLVIGLVVCAVLIGAVASWARKANHDIPQLQVGNKTRALIVESIADLGTFQAGNKQRRRFRVTVKNGYSQPVVAYVFDEKHKYIGERTTGGIETNGAVVGWELPPNGTDPTNFAVPANTEVVITLAAVLLKDGTGDGDFEPLSRLKENREGVKIAYQQIVPLLRRTLESNENPVTDAVIESLENEISVTADEKKLYINLRSSFLEAKNLILRDLRELRGHGRALEHRSEVSKIKARVEDLLAKF